MKDATKFVLRIFLLGFLISAQVVFFLPKETSSQTKEDVEKREAQLRAELAETEAEIAKWQVELQGKQKESASFERDVAILNAKIKEAQAVIRSRTIAIEKLGQEIHTRLENIDHLDAKIEKGKESLSQLLKRTNEISSFSLVEIVLSNDDLSEFLVDLDTFDSINKALHVSFSEFRAVKDQLEFEKADLQVKRNKETDQKVANETEKRKIEANEAERQHLLAVSRSQEKSYSQVIAERQARAAQIRAALFALRDSAPIPFGDALDLANATFQKTGVRPAFLLAIITQESNLGANVGTCNRPQDTKKWREIMPGPDDIAAGLSRRNDEAAFLRITSELGLDPNSMPLSCPWGNGWGGAMGPAQFIPTTWEIYKGKVAAALGISVANPWLPRDAFMASATYLGELGASAGGYTAERTAALKYYAGGNWHKPQNAFYGDQVMNIAQDIQENMINPLLEV
jgi:membrane-bound lytic murein transglycosylase B